ncbi:MAG TPA: sugar phosphate isomerase/epimerase family protein [Acidobacteriaceae bacterium]|nr:sugar phosphate isomerase/epimerase family protein [Acidobacteriaceae bacterium]
MAGAKDAIAQTAQEPARREALPADTPYPKLSIITPYSPEKFAFAAQAGYEGVVVTAGRDFNPNLSDSAIDQILAAARNAGIRIISFEYFSPNHTDPNAAKRASANAEFVRALEFCHRLGCKFVGTFSGGMPGAGMEDQAKAFADIFNEKYLPVCEKLDVSMGWENYPNSANFATVPAAMQAIFDRVPSKRLGLEFDPSHFVRQYIDPISVAWHFKDRILAVHAKDTEIIQPVLQQVGIAGEGWWRYRIPGQGIVNWREFLTVLLQIQFKGGIAVEHEDEFWDAPHSGNLRDFPQQRKDGFILARRFLGQYLPGRMA